MRQVLWLCLAVLGGSCVIRASADKPQKVIWEAKWKSAGRIAILPAIVTVPWSEIEGRDLRERLVAQHAAAMEMAGSLEAKLLRSGASLVPASDIAAALKETAWSPVDLLRTAGTGSWDSPTRILAGPGHRLTVLASESEVSSKSDAATAMRYEAAGLGKVLEGVAFGKTWAPSARMDRLSVIAQQLDADLVVLCFVGELREGMRIQATGEKVRVTQNFGSLWCPEMDTPAGNGVLAFTAQRSFWWSSESSLSTSSLVVRPSVNQIVARYSALGLAKEDGPVDGRTARKRDRNLREAARIALFTALDRMARDISRDLVTTWSPALYVHSR